MAKREQLQHFLILTSAQGFKEGFNLAHFSIGQFSMLESSVT
jgi:hypothetical protein